MFSASGYVILLPFQKSPLFTSIRMALSNDDFFLPHGDIAGVHFTY